ncbi:MAG: acyltransferase 3 [Rhodoferax sp.]|nr:acyltransferase 3 [Rhodoferax sp.]
MQREELRVHPAEAVSPSLPATPPRPSFPAIDVLRATAALMVLVFHVIVLGHWDGFPTTGPLRVFRNGWAGVDLFLVISGFVIALAALDGYDRQGTGFRTPFAVRRLARILPLYLVTGAVYLFVTRPEMLSGPLAELLGRLAAFLLFVQNLLPGWHGAINGPSWSVALEMQFYLLMLCITPWLARTRALPSLIGALLVAALYRLATTWLLPAQTHPITERFVYLTQLPGVIDLFGLGMLLALAVRSGRGWLARVLRPSWPHCLAWAAAAAVLLVIADRLFSRFGYWEQPAMLVAWRPLLSVALCALVASAIALPVANARWLAPLRYVGQISYGLYLWHFPVLVAITSRDPALSGWRLLLQVLAGTGVLAVLSWHLLEQPCIQRHKAWRAARAQA